MQKITGEKMKVWIRVLPFVCLLMIMAGCGRNDEDNSENTEEVNIATYGDAVPVPDTATETDATVDSSGFVVTNDYVVTNTGIVNMRVSPSTDADVYMVLENGVQLNRTGYNNEWTRVMVNDTDFYIYSDYVTQVEAGTDDTSEESKIIYIDAAKQSVGNSETEQVGPDSVTVKSKASSGAIGVETGQREYELTLSVAVKLKDELESRGYTVVLSRVSSDVSISNAERAEAANRSGADIYIKIQAGTSSDSSVAGIIGMCQTADNPYVNGNYSNSRRLTENIVSHTAEQTSAVNLGIYETDELASINWSTIPTTVISVGFLSNEAEDVQLATDTYRDELAKGIADGIDNYYQ